MNALEAVRVLDRDSRRDEGRTLSQEIYERLSDRIVRGEIAYGDKINIKATAKELGVSPMPIRDALKRLELEGIVVISPRSHCRVRVPTKTDVLNAIDSRRMIETFALSEVVGTVTPEALIRLEAIVSRMEETVRATPPRQSEYVDLDRAFHSQLCGLAENRYIDSYYHHINLHLSMSYRYGTGVCHGMEATLKEHIEIVELLRKNSPEAVTVLNEHLLKSRQNIQSEPGFLALKD